MNRDSALGALLIVGALGLVVVGHPLPERPPAPATAAVEQRSVPEAVSEPAPEPPKVGEDGDRAAAAVAAIVGPPLSRMKPPPPIFTKEKRERPRPKAVVKARPKQRTPTAGECSMLSAGLATIGRERVVKKAAGRGYTAAQVNWAISACGL